MRLITSLGGVGLLLLASVSSEALAQGAGGVESGEAAQMRAALAQAEARIADQQRQIQRQEERLRALELRLSATAPTTAASSPSGPAGADPRPAAAVNAAQASGATSPGDPAGVQQAPIEQVGQAPEGADRAPEVAVLGQQGSVVTRGGQLTAEGQIEYARADRNRAIFRGIEIVESVLVGVFDINESRQDVLTAAATFRYGLTDRLEVGVRLPFVYRSDASVLAPVMGSTANDPAATIDSSASGNGIGDIELSARYQLVDARRGWPFLIANLQAVIPTGTDPFEVPRDATGRALKAATGAGFYGISPSVTAILPSDPVVLFGTVGYTFNLASNVNTRIPPVMIERVDPGDAISGSAGIGISFNQRTTLNLGYAHSWALGSKTRTRLIDPTVSWPGAMTSKSRDLQIGRFLFGVTYRMSDRASLNWSVEVGATEDATDLRTVLRIPFVALSGR
ncbi:MAG: hypothetical protein JWM75_59 [Sphingomonas bacterium]|nr:hypothetical protein [Sphingomonas bacterium]